MFALHSKVVQNLAAAVGTVHSTMQSLIYCVIGLFTICLIHSGSDFLLVFICRPTSTFAANLSREDKLRLEDNRLFALADTLQRIGKLVQTET